MDNHNDNTLPAADTSFPPPFISEPKGYALSGKIMLSAIIILFAVVVIMVCFHIYARWYILRARRRNVRRARRRTHLVFYIEPNDPSNTATVPTRGLDASVIKSLPTFVYNNNNKNNTPSYSSELLECAVCLSEFEENEKGRMLPKCSHCFHVECIDMWFHSHDTCPLCRAPVDPSDLPPEKENASAELTPSQLTEPAESRHELDPSPSTSVGGRRKGAAELVGVRIEVPPRRCHSFSFANSDESGTSRSPTSRVLSLKRFLSREKKSPSGSRAEFDIELGRVDSVTPTSLTPR
ncbi:hypothetical protein RND81_14G062900 [Saponaria officinalis]|uniref:RING-type E3 ubiquitin transferase n=1 Tax=Saponaria officinalis TaxID=3572 RepID=A0AAW1GIZ4_SAPOF